MSKSDFIKIKKYSCFTPEEQEVYERLPPRQRLYIDYRGQGNSKTMAYKMAGFGAQTAPQAAYMLERRNRTIRELVDKIYAQKQVRDLAKQDSAINQKIDALATQAGAEKVLEVIEGADGETAKRIQFYRDVINGKIKTVRKVKKLNAAGVVTETRIEELSDVESKMKARKELDRILGLNQMIDLDKFQMGDITINIVDASKQDELEDSRNKVELGPDDVQVIDGEQVVVESEKVERENPREKFFASVEE